MAEACENEEEIPRVNTHHPLIASSSSGVDFDDEVGYNAILRDTQQLWHVPRNGPEHLSMLMLAIIILYTGNFGQGKEKISNTKIVLRLQSFM